MRYRLLGSSGLRVSELCLGAMTFGTEWGWGGDKATSKAIFDAYVEAGGTFIDTANIYTNGTSEQYVGEFVAAERERFVVATKFSLTMGSGNLNGAGNHRKNIVQSVEASLRRLKLDYIDLYWLHAWDFTTRPDEVLRALDDLVREGKVLYLGVSNTPAWTVAQLNTIAELRGWTPFIGVQIEYSLSQRTVERELLPMARTLGLTTLVWSPLDGGLLTGKYNQNPGYDGRLKRQPNVWAATERKLAIAAEVVAVAQELDRSPAQVALAWLRQQPDVIPIIGGSRLEQVEDNLRSVELTLSGEQLARLDAISAVELGYPHDFLADENQQGILFSQMPTQLVRRL